MPKTTSILIVQDEAPIAFDLQARLEGLGYTVPFVADDAAEALEAVKRPRPSLVLMDSRLPGKTNGVENAEQIRLRFHTPVIFVTANADASTLGCGKITEPFGYIVRPFDNVNFRAQVEIALRRHQMEEQLRSSEAWLSATFRNVADAFIATDREGNVAWMNPLAESFTGWESKDGKGLPLPEVFAAVDEITGAPVVHPVEPVCGDAQTQVNYECLKLRPRGSEAALLIEASVSSNIHEGSFLGLILAFRDISLRRRKEEESRRLQKMNALILMAEGLGRELAEAQRRMDESLTELISRAEGDSRRLLHRIADGCARQQSVIQQLVAPGRADTGEPTEVDLNALLAKMKTRFKRTLGPGRVLQFALGRGAPLIRIDPAGLQDSLLGLMAKVSQATVEGGLVEISTDWVALPDGRRGVRLVIRDNGEPVPASARVYVFDPSHHRRNSPAGLALSVIYRFVMLSGGKIDVASSPAEGTSYRLDFPVAEPVAQAAHVRHRVAVAV